MRISDGNQNNGEDEFIEDPSESEREDEITRGLRKYAQEHKSEWEARKKELGMESEESRDSRSGSSCAFIPLAAQTDNSGFVDWIVIAILFIGMSNKIAKFFGVKQL